MIHISLFSRWPCCQLNREWTGSHWVIGHKVVNERNLYMDPLRWAIKERSSFFSNGCYEASKVIIKQARSKRKSFTYLVFHDSVRPRLQSPSKITATVKHFWKHQKTEYPVWQCASHLVNEKGWIKTIPLTSEMQMIALKRKQVLSLSSHCGDTVDSLNENGNVVPHSLQNLWSGRSNQRRTNKMRMYSRLSISTS